MKLSLPARRRLARSTSSGAMPEAVVGDGEGVPGGGEAALHLDRLLGRGEGQAVLDQLGEDVGQVGGHGAGDRGGLEVAHDDPLVVLDLAEGGRTTSATFTGADHCGGGSMPASTRSDSALRRMRVARWSRRNRPSSVSGSASLRSRSVMKSSWRLSRFWLRRPRLMYESEMLRRSTACSTARSTALDCTFERAAATWLDLVLGLHRDRRDLGITTSSPAGCRGSGGRRRAAGVSAISSACRLSERSGRVMERLASQVTRRATDQPPDRDAHEESLPGEGLVLRRSAQRRAGRPPSCAGRCSRCRDRRRRRRAAGDLHAVAGEVPLDLPVEALHARLGEGLVGDAGVGPLALVRIVSSKPRLRSKSAATLLADGGLVEPAGDGGQHDVAHDAGPHLALAGGGVDDLGAVAERRVVDVQGHLGGAIEERLDDGPCTAGRRSRRTRRWSSPSDRRRRRRRTEALEVLERGPGRLEGVPHHGAAAGRLGGELLGRGVGEAPAPRGCPSRPGSAAAPRPIRLMAAVALVLQVDDEAARSERASTSSACDLASSTSSLALTTSKPATATSARSGTASGQRRASCGCGSCGTRRVSCAQR